VPFVGSREPDCHPPRQRVVNAHGFEAAAGAPPAAPPPTLTPTPVNHREPTPSQPSQRHKMAKVEFSPRRGELASLGSLLGSPRAAVDASRLSLTIPMGEPAKKPDAIDRADANFRKPSPSLDELLAGKKPFTSWDDLDIPDLTDEERDAFAAALADE
jgi:hypothetical protein